MEQPITFGALQSKPDYRDQYAAAAVAPVGAITLPQTLAPLLASPMMQAQEPACVSHSAVDVLKLYWFRKTGKWINFSPRFLDTLAKRFDGQDRVRGGTYPRPVFKLIAQYGCATESVLPNDTSLPVLAYRNDALLTDAVISRWNGYSPAELQAVIDRLPDNTYKWEAGSLPNLLCTGKVVYLTGFPVKQTN